MLRRLDCKSYRETLDSQHAAGRYNPASVIKPTIKGRQRRHVLPVGDSDNWDAYCEGERVYVVSINRRYGYCGVQAYDAEDQEPRDELSIFCQNDEHIVESLGKRGLDLTNRTIAKRLIDLLCEVTA